MEVDGRPTLDLAVSPLLTRSNRACGACDRSRRHPVAQAEGHIAAQAERHHVASKQTPESDHVNSTGPAHFIDPGIGEMKESATVSADQGAPAANGVFALHADGGGHAAIVESRAWNVDSNPQPVRESISKALDLRGCSRFCRPG